MNTDVVDAFAAPGGFICVDRGLREMREPRPNAPEAPEELPPPPQECRVEEDRG